jgi:Mn-dependent DtxR family transcriptional regulator
MEISSAHLRYLYTIYEISREVPDVCSASVADKMRVSKPSVARMLGILMKQKLIVKEPYGKIYLTNKGFLLARDFDRKVRLLTERIPRMGLALTEEETYAAVCAMALVFVGRESVHEKT